MSSRLKGCDSMRPLLVAVLLLFMTGACPADDRQQMDLMNMLQQRGVASKTITGAIRTFNSDGRRSIVDLYRAQLKLKNDYGWEMERVFCEEIDPGGGTKVLFPVNCLRTPHKGPALWILAGIHGEEPAGPIALTQNLKTLAALAGKKIPIVVFPLCNPLGYCRNWRYPDSAEYSKNAHSVGDSEHLLLDASGVPRRGEPSSRQCAALTAKVLELCRDYPPVLSIDFHEDNMMEGGFVYSQGVRGGADPIARKIITLFLENDFPLCLTDETDREEVIRDGIISQVNDGSVDELLSASRIFRDGVITSGPTCRSVIVLETGSKNCPLSLRVKIQSRVMRMLEEFWRMASGEAIGT